MLFEVKDLTVSYGDLEVVHGVSFSVEPGQITALLGANGAGKSSIMGAISGLIPGVTGSVKLAGKELLGMSAHRIVAEGLRHVPEGRRIFSSLTVRENLIIGAYSQRHNMKEVHRRIEDVYRRFPILEERSKQLAGHLSGGEQQMLAVGRALITAPKVLALDEPSLGLSPKMTHEILSTVSEIAEQGTAVLLVEQNALEALAIADRAAVLELGRIAISGKAEEVAKDPAIASTYLGGAAEVGNEQGGEA